MKSLWKIKADEIKWTNEGGHGSIRADRSE